ncbi:MAG: S9 family peptidase [Ignavibacteria bacterium]
MCEVHSFVYLFTVFLSLTTLYAQRKELSVDLIYNSRVFTVNQLHGVQWSGDGNKYLFLKPDTATECTAIYQYDVVSGEESLFITGDELKIKETDEPFVIMNYIFSPDGGSILFTGILPARRLKTGGAFYIYNIKAKKFSLLAQSGEEQSNARFSPDGKKLGFVRGNNLFVVDIATKKQTQLTFDGSNVILNGRFDWVYEEEFSIINGFEWSPDSRTIGYWRLDQSLVPEVQIARYDSLYFNFLKYHYPKPGGNNSIVKIGAVNISNGKTVWMDLGRETDIYVPRIRFTADPGILSVQKLNRRQNHLELLFCNVKTGASKIIIDEKAPEWIDIQDDLTFLQDGKRFLWSSEKDGYLHLYLYDYSGRRLSRLTKGDFVVSKLISVDETLGRAYYMSNERGRRFKDLYSVKLDGSRKKRITEEAGTHIISMSANSKYFIDRYSNAGSMPGTSLCRSDGSKLTNLISTDNKILQDYGIQKTEFFTFKTSDNVELDASIIKPADFDQNKKYPVIIMQYNGPGSQSVNDGWGAASLWGYMLAQKGCVIVSVDCRITGGKGEQAKRWAYRNLGKWEINDIIETAKYLKTLNYVDSERLGIWGWSYGGYISALSILKATDYFKTAVAVAPVTHWKFYDSVYTERYMLTPELNPDGYEESSPLNAVDKLKGKFLLIHGMADDNVHFQNSAELVNKLVAANKQFSVMYYPDCGHGINGGNARVHLYNLMTDYFLNNL